MIYVFDGENRTITPTSTDPFTVVDMYSRWKEWLVLSDNSKHPIAFRSVAGDPIGPGQTISPYVFLNTVDGWKIKPYEADYELKISGNLYAEDPDDAMFAPTIGSFTVSVIVERSSASISTTVGGIDQATVQAALSAQGYTTSRALAIDNLDQPISSGSLSNTQQTMLLEMYRILGLDPTLPLVVTPTSRKVPANGSEIEQSISKVGTVVTVTRS